MLNFKLESKDTWTLSQKNKISIDFILIFFYDFAVLALDHRNTACNNNLQK